MHRILAGERDIKALLANLHDTDSVIVTNVLGTLGGEVGGTDKSDETDQPDQTD